MSMLMSTSLLTLLRLSARQSSVEPTVEEPVEYTRACGQLTKGGRI